MDSRGAPFDNGRVDSGEISAPGSRIEPRRLVWAVAEVCWADAAGHIFRARATIVDISASGACIRLKDPIGIGSRLTVKWRREQFAAIARNCRSDGPDYLLGVRRDSSHASEPAPANASPKSPALPASAVSAANIATNNTASPSLQVPVRGATPSKTVPARNAERHSETIPAESTRTVDPETRRASARREAASQERKGMHRKGFFPNFWHRRHEAGAPAQVALKETPVNKPSTQVVEHVTDPPSRLLSYDDIYHAAGIMDPRSGYGIHKVVDMLNSDRIRDLSKDIQRASVLMALDAAGASVGDLLQDATRRQNALNAYEDGQRKQLEEFEARKAQENAQIHAEMQRITAHYAERIQQNKEEVGKHKEALHNWQMAKQHESQRIGEVMELCGKPASPGASNSMAAAAGAGTSPASVK